MKISLKKDHSAVPIIIPDEKIIDVLEGRSVPGLSHESIQQIIADGIRNQCPGSVVHQKIAVIVPDDTRLWARGDLYVPSILKALFDLGVAPDQVKVIIALGTHKDLESETFAQLAGAFSVRHVEILNSANANRDRLIDLGRTSRNTRLYVTKEAVEADHIIIFGGILHHLIAGFGGGRKYIMPGIAGYDMIH